MIFEPMSEKFEGLMQDESRTVGYADFVARPCDAAQLKEAVRQAGGMKITVQGAATGLEGKGVPQGGLLISTRGMNEILGLCEQDGRRFLRVQAGVTLEQIEEYLRKHAHFFPPNPSEKSATIGGAAASEAVGIRGSVCDYVNNILRIDGVIAELELVLKPKPLINWGVLVFDAKIPPQCETLAGCAYFDEQAMALLRGHYDALKLPEDAREALYLEFAGDDEEAIEEALMQLPEDAWAAEGLAEMEKFRKLCHAVPEILSETQPGLAKAAIDRMYIDFLT